jgi:LysR family transcriptional regulator, benzoate and cis,cis-muconate-responsive activator of ben and cat genes
MTLPSIRDLEVFEAIAEELSFRRAADRLFLDQSALSRRLMALEHSVGYALVARTTRDVHLTEAGRSFYEAAKPLLRSLGDAVAAGRAVAQGKTGQLRIAYMSFAATGLMPAIVRRFSAEFPDVSLDLAQMRTQAQKIALSRGTVDIGFLLGPFSNPGYLVHSLRRERLAVIMAENHPLAAQGDIHLADLGRTKVILGSREQWDFFRTLLEEMFAARGIEIASLYEPSDALGLFGLVGAGLGVSIYVESIAEIAPRGIIARPIADCPMEIETLLCWRRDSDNPALRRFVELAG